MTGAISVDRSEATPGWETEAKYLAAEIQGALRLLTSVDWILRVHRKTTEANFDDEELAGVVGMIREKLDDAASPYEVPSALRSSVEMSSSVQSSRE